MRLPPVLLNLIASLILILTTTVAADSVSDAPGANALLRVGVAEQDITPPTEFPMAGYYHERLAEGTINPLKAKAIVTLPGAIFVDWGLAIEQASPFRTTIVVELANVVETIYIPHRVTYAGGSYEVTNSTVMPGSGEMLVESAVRLLRQTASENEQVKSTQPNSEDVSHSRSSPLRSTANTLVVASPQPPAEAPQTRVHVDETSLRTAAVEKAEDDNPIPKREPARIEHTVTFRLKHPSGSKAESSFLNAAAELATIPGVRDFQIRRQTSSKNSHAFGISMQFDSPAQYQAYNDDPLHVRFVQQRWLNEVVDFQEADFEPLD